MANIKSAIKRIRVSERQRLRNKAAKSAMKTAIKKYLQALEANDAETARQRLQKAFSLIDKAAEKGIIHKNQAARRKSRLAKKLTNVA